MDVEKMAEVKVDTDKVASEFLGTMVLVLIGMGAMSGMDNFEGALAFGLAYAMMVTLTMNTSGAHLNPAITLGMVAMKKMDNQTGFWYIVVQCMGALAGMVVLVNVLDGSMPGVQDNSAGASVWYVLAGEAIMGFLLMLTWLATVNKGTTPGIAGFGVGLMAALMLMVGDFAMNPGTHLAGALHVGNLSGGTFWMYWLGPIVGCAAAAMFWDQVYEEE